MIGDEVHVVKVDVSDEEAVETARDQTLKLLGKIDILVNNAGIAGVNKTVWETDFNEWRKVLRINLDGPFLCCKAIVPVMREKNYGRIVNIASIAGKEGNPNAAHYSASKAGLIALTKSLGKELAQTNIAVNCVTPAAAKTAIFDQDATAHRLHAVEDSARTLRQGGGAGLDGGVDGKRRMRLHDRRRVRSVRRPRDVLNHSIPSVRARTMPLLPRLSHKSRRAVHSISIFAPGNARNATPMFDRAGNGSRTCCV